MQAFGLLVIFALFYAGIASAETAKCQSHTQGHTFDITCPTRHKSGLTAYILRGDLDQSDPSGTFQPTELEFLQGTTSRQKIAITTPTLYSFNLEAPGLLNWVDLNKDGYDDFRLLQDNTRRNQVFTVYVYNPATKNFETSDELSEIGFGELSLNPDGTVSTSTHDNETEETLVFKVEGVHLKRMKSEHQKMSD